MAKPQEGDIKNEYGVRYIYKDGKWEMDHEAMKATGAKQAERIENSSNALSKLFKKSEQTTSPTTKTETQSVAPTVSNDTKLGGMTTNEWVKSKVDEGWTKEQIEKAYEDEGYSRGGSKFLSSMDAYYNNNSKKTDNPESQDTLSPVKQSKKQQSSLSKNKTADEAIDKKLKNLDSVLEKRKGYKQTFSQDMTDLEELLGDKLDKEKDISDISKYLPKLAISRYLSGDFGEDSAEAQTTLGYFLLDKLGSSLVNASQIARGMTPTQKSALQSFNEQYMDNALTRDDKKQTKITDISLDTFSKNSDALREVGIEDIKLGNDTISKALSKYADKIDDKAFMQLYQEEAEWLDRMSPEDKESYLRLLALKSTDANTQALALADYQESMLKAKYATSEAEQVVQEQRAVEVRLKNALTSKELENYDNIMKQARLQNDYTTEQINMIKENLIKAKTENKYLGAKQIMDIVSSGASAVSGVADAIIPF